MRTKGYQRRLQHIIYEYISRSLFKADRLMFAVHLVSRMYSQQIQENVSILLLKPVECSFLVQYSNDV